MAAFNCEQSSPWNNKFISKSDLALLTALETGRVQNRNTPLHNAQVVEVKCHHAHFQMKRESVLSRKQTLTMLNPAKHTAFQVHNNGMQT
jgi:hypothetical protein